MFYRVVGLLFGVLGEGLG